MSWSREFLQKRLVKLGILTQRQAEHESTEELEKYYWNYQEKQRQEKGISESRNDFYEGDDW